MSKNYAIANKYAADVLDPTKCQLVCEVHNYVAGGAPRQHTGCYKCVLADFVYMFARVPKERQQEEFDKFEGLVHAMCELEDEGQLKIDLTNRPKISIESVPDSEEDEVLNAPI